MLQCNKIKLAGEPTMYNEMINNFKAQMAPFTQMATINQKAVEKLVAIQQEAATELFNTGVAQAKALVEVKEPKAALDLQVAYFKNLEAKLTAVAEEEITTLNAARNELTAVLEKSVAEMTETAEKAMKDFGSFDAAAFDMSKFDLAKFDLSKVVPAFVADAVKPAAKKPATRKVAAPKAASAE
jgi:hypothetical protein